MKWVHSSVSPPSLISFPVIELVHLVSQAVVPALRGARPLLASFEAQSGINLSQMSRTLTFSGVTSRSDLNRTLARVRYQQSALVTARVYWLAPKRQCAFL